MQPDLLAACDLKNNVTEKGRYMGTPALVIEVLSDSTRTKDLVTKLNTYTTSDVKEYWIIDQKQEMITIYSFKDYEVDIYISCRNGDTAQSYIFDGLSVDVNEIFENLI